MTSVDVLPSLPPALKGLEVVRAGDPKGNGMVLELTAASGKRVWAIGVPQPYSTSTGPTWVYVIDADGLSLIDAGGDSSKEPVQSGLALLGKRLDEVQRIVITHGHNDHDGGLGELLAASGAEAWAHELYAHLISEGSWRAHAGVNPLLRQLMPWSEEREGHRPPGLGEEAPHWWKHHLDYLEMRRHLKVARPLKNHDTWAGLTFLHTPGHSPDELSITMDGVVFTGDHVLPEITPHPTVEMDYPKDMPRELRREYPPQEQYGLQVYLKSLNTVARLDPSVLVLPAHRLYNRGKFNLLTVKRAADIAVHHVRRLRRITRKLAEQEMTLEELTRSTFPTSKLSGGNFMAGVTEVVSHVEVLLDAGDVSVTPEGKFRWLGTERFQQRVASLAH